MCVCMGKVRKKFAAYIAQRSPGAQPQIQFNYRVQEFIVQIDTQTHSCIVV